MNPLETWLAAATKGLSPESTERVRSEIQQHYDSASESGDDPIAALGDPKAANRGYRGVLITEYEQAMAPALTQSQPRSLTNFLVAAVILAPVIWAQFNVSSSKMPGARLIALAIFSTSPFSWAFHRNTLERARLFLYVSAVKNIVVMGLNWWYQGWISGIALGATCFLLDYAFSYRRLAIFRKLAAGQVVSPFAGEPDLTHNEAIWLNSLRKGSSTAENISVGILFVMLGALSVWQPATFAPMSVCMALGFIAQRTLHVYTPEGSRWFRLAKWTAMCIAGILPVVYGARGPWIGAVFLGFFFVLFDRNNISLRRKLPVSEWPKRLYW